MQGDGEAEERVARARGAFASLEAADAGGFAFLPGSGESKVLITAPHAAEHPRGDKMLPAEDFTGVIACALAEQPGCATFVKVSPRGGDPNNDEESPFRDAVVSHVRSAGVSVVLDVHQMHPRREHDLMIGTGEGRNVLGRDDLAQTIAECFRECGIENVGIDEYFRALGVNRVSSAVARDCGVPGLQLELNTALVYDKSERYCPDRVIAALELAASRLG